jgi:tetratricopeptide (TPR) repeat protein
MQLEQLIQIVKKKGKNLILITPPINLEALPLRVCENTTSDKIMALQDYIFSLIQEGKFQEALKEALDLKKLMPANALTSYLLGNIYTHLGQSREGVSSYEEASALDCSLWRADAVIVSIIRKLSLRHDVYLYDYHQNMSQILGKNILFLDDFHPQSLFDENMLKSLVTPIREYLKI